MFFTAVNPMDDDQSMEEIRNDLDKPKIAPYKNTGRPHQNTVHWCNLKLAQKKGLQFYQTRSHAIVLYKTLPAICIEKAVCMKTGEELYHKVYQSPRLPRVTLKPNSQCGQQGQLDQEARKSSDHRRVPGRYGETCSGNVDYRTPGILHSSPTTGYESQRNGQKVDSAVRESPEQGVFLQDLSKTEEINAFSERSKKLITDMGNTEIFELCETSSKKQCTRLCLLLGTWHRKVFIWKKSKTLAKDLTVRQEEL